MSEELKRFTINDFPPEIIERFIPELKAKTVSNLKLVSKKFYSVFNSDRFYKCYLIYTEESFLSDFEFESKAPGVKEIVENIKNGVYGKWEGFLRLQKAHLQNLRNGRLDSFDLIHVKGCGRRLHCWREFTDENNKVWLCVVFTNGNITMVNLTTKQELTYNLQFDEIHFLHGLVLLQVSMLKFSVYKLITQEEICTLQLQCETSFSREIRMDRPQPCSSELFKYEVMSGKGKSAHLVKNILLGVETRNTRIHMWDLDSNAKSVLPLEKREHFDYAFSYKGVFPNIIISTTFRKEFDLHVINVETKHVTHIISIINAHVYDVTMSSSDIVHVLFNRSFNRSLNRSLNFLNTYRLSYFGSGGLCDVELLQSLKLDLPLSCDFCESPLPCGFFWTEENVEVEEGVNGDVIHLFKINDSGNGLQKISFPVPSDYVLLGFLLPDIIFVTLQPLFRYFNSDDEFETDVDCAFPVQVRTLTGQHLFNWPFECDQSAYRLRDWCYPSRKVAFLSFSRNGPDYTFKTFYF